MKRRAVISALLLGLLLPSAAVARGRRSGRRRGASGGGRSSSAPSEDVYFSSCKDAKAQGYRRIRQGQPGYRSGLDRDGDGVACE